MRKFLTAEWRDLIMVNYEVDPLLLAPRVPAGTELDLENGRCFVSLVGFMFLNTRVLGVPVPFHINFEEVNLRFYIRREAEGEVRRAVCFIKEIVPRFAIAAVARELYSEPYECWTMGHGRTNASASYSWRRGDLKNSMTVRIGERLGVPPADSHGEFIIEHYWGYTERGRGRVDEYKVEHPKWVLYDAELTDLHVDFDAVYGPEFALLTASKPYSALFAAGSPVSVYKGARIR